MIKYNGRKIKSTFLENKACLYKWQHDIMLPFIMACLFPESMNAFRAHPVTALSANTQGVKGERTKQKKNSSRSLNVILFGGGTYHQVVLIFRLYLCWIPWLLLGIPKLTTGTWFELPWQLLNISTSCAMHLL